MIFVGVLGAPALTFSYIDFSESISSALSLPAGAQAGDFAVYAEWSLSFSGRPSAVTPSGWSQLVNNADVSNLRCCVYRKVLTSGDVSAGSITGMDGDLTDFKIMLLFRPSKTIATTTDSTWTQQATDGNPSAQNIAGNGQAAPLLAVAFAAVAAGGTINPFSWSPAYDALITPANGANTMRATYKIYNTAPADISIDIDDEGGGNFLTGGYSRFT